MTTPNLAPNTHRHTGAVKKLLAAFAAETGLDPKEVPDQFSNWLSIRPKLKAATKEHYRRHASKLLAVDVPAFQIPTTGTNRKGKRASANPSLNLDTYNATIKNLQRISQTNEITAIEKQIALAFFVCTAITGYSIANLLTASSLIIQDSKHDETCLCELTLHPASRNKSPQPITLYCSSLSQLEIYQIQFLLSFVQLYPKNPELFRKIHKKAFDYISNANPVKQFSLWDMRRIYPAVLGYKK